MFVGGATVGLNKSLLRETQSCEMLVTARKHLLQDTVRKTVSVASAARIKDDNNIMRNIKKREVVNALKGNNKSISMGLGGGLSNSQKMGSNLGSKNFSLSVSSKHEPSWKDSQFVTELLDWHNLLRARHGVKQLQLNTDLCKMAQTWANFLAHTNEFHYQNPKEVSKLNIYASLFVLTLKIHKVWRKLVVVASANITPLLPGQEMSRCDWQICGHILVQKSFIISISCRP